MAADEKNQANEETDARFASPFEQAVASPSRSSASLQLAEVFSTSARDPHRSDRPT